MNASMVAYTFYEADNRVRRYAESLVQRGDRVDVIALRRPGLPAYEVLRGVHVYRLQERTIDERGPLTYLVKLILFFLRSGAFLARRHMTAPYQLIHVHSVPDFEVFAALVPRLAGAKVILDVHDIVPEFYASKFQVSERSLVFRMLLLVERLSSAFAHHVIIANHLWYEKFVARSSAANRCTPMINYPDTSIFYRREPAPEDADRFVLCYPGTLNWHQGLDVAIRAMPLIRKEVPNVLLQIIGDGPERANLAKMIQEGGMSDYVRLSGLVPLERVAEIMSSVDLGVVPKRSDSFGNEAFSTKIMEFMAMGVPVLASETRIDRYYFDGGLVQFFRSGDSADFADKVIELARDSYKRTALRGRADAFIAQQSWDQRKFDYYDLVDRLVAAQA